jgi:protein TonB
MAQPQVAVTLPYIPDIAPDVPPPAPVNSAAITATPTRSTPAAPVYSAEPYETVILRYINSHMRYPTAARARRQEGTVYVRVVMDRAGRVLSSQVERSSRFTTLDEEGLALLQRAQPLPAPPASVAGDSFQFVIPIVFRLRS